MGKKAFFAEREVNRAPFVASRKILQRPDVHAGKPHQRKDKVDQLAGQLVELYFFKKKQFEKGEPEAIVDDDFSCRFFWRKGLCYGVTAEPS